MIILDYDEIDPLQVLLINHLALGCAHTPELVAHIHQFDPRPFPGLTVYAVEDTEMGQEGLTRTYSNCGPSSPPNS